MGRPKSYERGEVVERALVLFRERGYAGTSVDDLVRSTGINRAALYEEFGDKRGLFLEVLERFQSAKRHDAEILLAQPGPKLPLFRRYLERISGSGRQGGPVNCLVTISAVNLASGDPEIAACVLGHFRALECAFIAALEEARDQGEIATGLDLRSLARTLINAGRGMRIIAQFEGFDATTADIIETTLELLRPTLAFQNACSE